MSSGIDLNVDTAFYADRPAWHRFGDVVPAEDLADRKFMEVMVEWGMCYDVRTMEVFGVVLVPGADGQMHEVMVEFPGFVGLYNGTEVDAMPSGGVVQGLHVHQDGYTVGQNEELARFLDGINEGTIDGKRVVRPEAGVTLFGKKVCVVTGKFTEPLRLNGGDMIDPYIVARTSHDGSYATGVRTNMYRVECRNMLNASLRGKAQFDISFKHTIGREAKVAAAIKDLSLAINDVRNFEIEANAMIDSPFSDGDLDAFLKTLLPVDDDAKENDRTKVLAQRATITGLWASDPRVGNYRGTRWGAFQAVSTWEQWMTPGRDVALRNTKAIVGSGFAVSNTAGKLLAVPA